MYIFSDVWSNGIDTAIVKQNIPFAVHTVMFLPALMSQCTPEQQAEWLGRAYTNSILGTYAQVTVNISIVIHKGG